MDIERLKKGLELDSSIEKVKDEISILNWALNTQVRIELVVNKKVIRINDYCRKIILPVMKVDKEKLLKELQEEFERL